MRGRLFALFLALAGCGGGEMSSAAVAASSAAVSIPADALPVILEGKFELSVEKGDVNAAGISEINFGTLDVNGAMHVVQLSGAVLGAAGLDRAGGVVRMTLGSRTDAYGVPTYIVTAMKKVEAPSAAQRKQ